MSIVRHECENPKSHEIHVWETPDASQWVCAGHNVAYYALAPDELVELHKLDMDTLKADSLDVYLAAAPASRNSKGFQSLWNKWARGKSNMPLCVERAAGDPREGDAARTVLDYLARHRETVYA
jgi:hypothetical protein